MKTLTVLIAVAVTLLLLIQVGSTQESTYGDTYTAEELAAVDRALWAGNMTREDLTFRKNLTKGTGCYPVVADMMHDPLLIAPWMDTLAGSTQRDMADFELYRMLVNTESLSTITHNSDYAEYVADPLPADQQQLIDLLVQVCGAAARPTADYPDYEWLRGNITTALAWHNFERTAVEGGYNEAKADSDPSLYETLDQLSPDWGKLADFYRLVQRLRDTPDLPALFPTDTYRVFHTELGQVALGTPYDDDYYGDYVILIDPGGNDTYHNCRIGAAYGKRTYGGRMGDGGEATGASADYTALGDGRVGLFIDLSGDDYYDCADVDVNLGAAVLGVAAFYDIGGGDDRYYGGYCSLGAAMGGIATFYDDGGCDYYSGKAYTQGAAGFGIGIMVDDSVADAPVFDTAEGNDALIDAYANGESEIDTHNLEDNDFYTAWSEAQAFSRPRGLALCVNRRGNELYHAGGVYTDAPLFADRYQSFSQGFAIGERGIDWAGGIAMLIDYAGNDRYLGDIYNQGVGYWYSAGFLWDGAGNDTYEMTQYGQGSGIHLAIGGLVDVSGSDTYVMHSGLGQGSSHDLAASILHDRGGDDRYDGNTTCNGSALAGSVGLFIDRSGLDTYAGRRGSINTGDTRRTNVGVFVDLGGNDDDYMSQVMADGRVWTQANIGMGVDEAPPPEDEETAAASTSGPNQLSTGEENIPIPEICSYEGELTQEVFDELWEIAIRWEVGDNRVIVPHARERLIAFGPAVLPFLSDVMDDSNSGLALRAFQDIYAALWDEDAEGVSAVLRENAVAMDDETRRTNALYLIGELGYTELEDVAVVMLDDPVPSLQRRAIGVLGKLGSHSADERLIAMLDPATNDELVISAALTTLTDLEVDCYNELRGLLDYPLVSVREQLVKQLAKHWGTYGTQTACLVIGISDQYTGRTADAALLTESYGEAATVPELQSPASPRMIRSALDVLLQGQAEPQWILADAIAPLLTHDDWGVRASAVRLTNYWISMAEQDEMLWEQIVPVVVGLDELDQTESDPYVLSVMEQED